MDTIIAIATALGKGAIGIVRISGTRALDIAQAFVATPHPLATVPSHTVHHGYLVENGSRFDDVLITVMRGPSTYTGEDTVEISCHNNILILEKILALGTANGARCARPGEFTERAFLHGKMDLAQAEAVADLIASETQCAEHIAFEQRMGYVSKTVEQWRTMLTDVCADIEAALDHDETPMPDATRIVQTITSLSDEMQQHIQSGMHAATLCTGLTIVFAGKPNVGKSSLFNALIKKEKAIVSSVPGTTRDPIEAHIEFRGMKLVLIDTAGVRQHAENEPQSRHHEIEALGIAKTHEHCTAADYVVFILDCAEGIDEHDMVFAECVKGKKIILVGNKCDCGIHLDEKKLAALQSLLAPIAYLVVSVRTGEHVENILDACIDNADAHDVLATMHARKATTLMVNARHRSLVEQACAFLDDARQRMDHKESWDVVAGAVHDANNRLGEIVGVGITDEVLELIFSRFCVGK